MERVHISYLYLCTGLSPGTRATSCANVYQSQNHPFLFTADRITCSSLKSFTNYLVTLGKSLPSLINLAVEMLALPTSPVSTCLLSILCHTGLSFPNPSTALEPKDPHCGKISTLEHKYWHFHGGHPDTGLKSTFGKWEPGRHNNTVGDLR